MPKDKFIIAISPPPKITPRAAKLEAAALIEYKAENKNAMIIWRKFIWVPNNSGDKNCSNYAPYCNLSFLLFLIYRHHIR
jgi:hypothetical protein